MIRHILFWNYTDEVKEKHQEKETLIKLKESVETLKDIEGLLCVEMEENLSSGYDLVFYSEFEISIKTSIGNCSARTVKSKLYFFRDPFMAIWIV